ncbi:MAG: Phytanoyl-CoA dioxygenase (PhyH) [Chloroflexi bacterium ADurb.Bin325]|nr:MAG: Phytanoyl-CoA dioxygenase (PhyH) [Chloroflexi bacterium ADurb.Bin325]
MTTTAVAAQTDLRSQYDRDGWVAAHAVVDEGLMAEARSHVDWLLAKHPGVRPEQLHHHLMTNDPFWVRLISDPRLLDVVEQFIGPDIALFASHYIAKRPHDGQSVLWHQDGSFWPLEPMEVVTLWLAVDDADVENGCLRVLSGTQNQRLLKLDEMERQDDGRNVLGTGIRPSELDESQAVDVILKAGDVEIHHPNIIHGSNANISARWRRGLTIRYIPTSTRIVSEERWAGAFLLRGRAHPNVDNRYHPFPLFVGGEHMPFHDWQAWNEYARSWNATNGFAP